MIVKRTMLYFLCVLGAAVHAQHTEALALNIGDPAPPLYVEEWLNAAHGDGAGIPKSFVVDRGGRSAWIGHPSGLDELIRKIRYPPDYGKQGYVERSDSLLSVIAEIVEEEPMFIYPETADLSYDYSQMAEWYWRAGHQREAIAAQKKAVKALKRKARVSAADLAEPKARLQSYKIIENR